MARSRRNVACLQAAAVLFLTVLFCPPDCVRAQSQYSGFAPTSPAFSLRSPYTALTKTRQLLNTLAIQALLFLDYTEYDAGTGNWKTADLPGVETGRYFSKQLAGGASRTVEIAVTAYPEGGYEYYVYGLEIGADGTRAPNPDLYYIQQTAQTLVQTIQAEQQTVGTEDLEYQLYHLSYVQSDRALALLKSLGYTTIEYAQQAGETLYDRIYSPVQNGQWRLPVIVKLIDATKTSLMDPSPSAGGYAQQQSYGQAGYGQPSGVSDLGGTFLHQMTSGEPQQRLLIAYNGNDPESIEPLLNLLRGKIDRKARQIVIEALVIEVNTDRSKELGLTIAASKDKYGVSYGEENTTGEQLPFSFVFGKNGGFDQYGRLVENSFGNAFGNFLSFRSILKAMVKTGDAEILSSPSVLVLDGRQARIQVGQQIPVSKTIGTTGGFAATGVDYFQTGIVLNLRPRISEDGSEITMQVETIVSAVNQAASIQRASEESGVLLAPTVDNRQVQTFVRVADNTPFIIGGLISTDRQDRTVGIPILSRIPILGIPFRRTVADNKKKEVIVVLTPHVAPLEEKSFSYVIPKDSEIFDSFSNELFRNAYRIRDDDVFDLKFLYGSEIFQNLIAVLEQRSEEDPSIRTREPYAPLFNGEVPGEEILVRRMLWEIVHKTGFTRHIAEERIILFEDQPNAPDSSGFRTAFLHRLLADREQKKQNTLVLTFDARSRGTPKHPFVQPKATISYEDLEPETYIARLMQGNRRQPDGTPNRWTMLLSRVNPPGVRGATAIQVLQGVLVLKRILALNRTLPLTIKEFRVGRQIIFPTEQDLQQRYHIIDRNAAQFFYEAIQYYPEFEKAFNLRTRYIMDQMEASGK